MAADFAPSSITLPFGDGEYHFRLGLVQLAELQTKCGAGLGRIFARVLKGRLLLADGRSIGDPESAEWHVSDLVETIRLALVGGGGGVVDERPVTVGPVEAKRLIEAYVIGRPLRESWTTAAAILAACVEGYRPPDAPVPKAEPPARRRTRKAGSTSPKL